jgi:hypothetical protein
MVAAKHRSVFEGHLDTVRKLRTWMGDTFVPSPENSKHLIERELPERHYHAGGTKDLHLLFEIRPTAVSLGGARAVRRRSAPDGRRNVGSRQT